MQSKMLLGSALVATGLSAVVLPALTSTESVVRSRGPAAVEVGGEEDGISHSQIWGAVAAATGLVLITP
jgi:hypothetical protein